MKISGQATHPYTQCPDVNIAIVRAGLNADVTNPYYLYNVNQSTGIMSLVTGGPYKDPTNPVNNLQINGIGVNRVDGYIYGLAFDGTTTTARFMRLDSSYGVTDLGAVPSPASSSGLLGFVNPAAGDVDTAGNYFFSGFTVNPTPSPTFDNFYLGRITNTQNITSGPPLIEYFKVDVSGANCSAYITSLTADPANSGLKDFSYNARTNSFFTYATYKLPGAANFSGQVLELVYVGGSGPFQYRLICNPIVNTHTAETSGTLIDKTGKFTVLFTDGSFGMLNGNASSGFNGMFTLITTSTGLPNPLRGDMGSCGQGSPVIHVPMPANCPANYAAVRAGTNADITNPYSLYTVNGATGAFTLIPGGPLYYPGTLQTLQINGIGINKKDGNIYGMAYEGSLNTARFVKTDVAYNVALIGNIPPPISTDGSQGFVNSAAGDMDSKGNYFFTAVTTKAGNGPNGRVIEKLWIGKIANTDTVTTSPSPTYYELDWSGNPCSDFINSLNIDPINSGVKDFFYHPATRTFFSYVTYKLPGDIQFRGQMIEVKPIGNPESPGSYRMFCKNEMNTHTAETSGTMVTNAGEFIILMTDGRVGRIPRTGSSFNYSGQYVVLNNNTGLPSVIRADLASCTDLSHPGGNGNNVSNSNRISMVFGLQPNPIEMGQNLVLRWLTVSEPALVDVIVYDSYGVPVRTIRNVLATVGDQLSINVGNLAAGIFYVHAVSKNKKSDYKLKFIKVN